MTVDGPLAEDIKKLADEIEEHETDDMTDASWDFYEAVKEICLDLQRHFESSKGGNSS